MWCTDIIPKVWWFILTVNVWFPKEPIMVLFVVFFYSGLRFPKSPWLGFITMFLIICVSLWCFTDEVEDPDTDWLYICNLELHQNYRWGFALVKLNCIQMCKSLESVLPCIRKSSGTRHWVQGSRAKHSLSLCTSEPWFKPSNTSPTDGFKVVPLLWNFSTKTYVVGTH